MTSLIPGIKSQIKWTWQWQQFARLLTKSAWVAEIDCTVLRFLWSTDTFSLCQPMLITTVIWDLCVKEAEVKGPQCISIKLEYRWAHNKAFWNERYTDWTSKGLSFYKETLLYVSLVVVSLGSKTSYPLLTNEVHESGTVRSRHLHCCNTCTVSSLWLFPIT